VRKQRVDPELTRQLEQGAATNGPVEAVFTLRCEKSAREFLSPEETVTLAQRLLKRVSEETREEPQAVNVFRNLGSFVVVAPSRFVRRLLDQAEISSAVANRQPGDSLIRPRRKRAL
jgi:hypothetical protein